MFPAIIDLLLLLQNILFLTTAHTGFCNNHIATSAYCAKLSWNKAVHPTQLTPVHQNIANFKTIFHLL